VSTAGSGPSRIRVGAGVSGYDVVVGEQVLGELAGLLGDGVVRVAVVHAEGAAVARVAAEVLGALEAAGLRAVLVPVPDGEAAKRAGVVTDVWSTLGRADFTRSDAVVAVGGGATTDAAGFAAATWLRGIRFATVPTTLLGMVDAAVGGKTGIDTAEGKNLVGAYHPPVGVVVDLATLATLPGPEYVSGLAEVVKTGFIADPAILDLIEAEPEAVRSGAGPHTRELVERSLRVKAAVVSADLRDSGPREMLNYGHTLGHAIEKVEGYRWRHGDAVSVGMVFAAELSSLSGRLDRASTDRHRSLLDSIGLPTGYRAGAWADLQQAMKVDKKTRGDTLRFVVLDSIAAPVILEGPDPAMLEAAYAQVSR
jgi:3-dehydroquinate synthase